MGYTEKAVVIGAGISGLVCAYRLKRLGVPCRVLEASERPGGVIATIRRNGFLFETGPQFPRFPEPVWRLVLELGLEPEFISGDKKAKRYILRDGAMHQAPFSPGSLLRTRLVGSASKFRLLSEAFRISRPPVEEESLAEFIRRKFGAEVLDNLVEPIISTIFFADPEKMGMESAFPNLVRWERERGSLVRGAILAQKARKNGRSNGTRAGSHGNEQRLHVTAALPSLGTFQSGMARLPERLAQELRAEIAYRVEAVFVAPIRHEDRTVAHAWEIGLANGDKIITEHLVLAVPAYAAGQLLTQGVAQLASLLGGIQYAPMCAVSCAYDRSQIRHRLDGFGFMVPRQQGLRTICTFFNSSLFPGRGPEGKVVLTSFAGGTPDLPKEEYAATLEAENSATLGIAGHPVDRVIWSSRRAMPQYNVGHARRVAEIHDRLHDEPNLHFIGNFLEGRSIGDCAQIAERAAQEVRSRTAA